jgi:hypothetical protein
MYIGQSATTPAAYDFDGGQVRVHFNSGATSVTFGGNTSFVTDPITFAPSNVKDLIIAVHFNAATDLAQWTSITGAATYYKVAADETSVSVVTGYATSASVVDLIQKVEVQ